MKLSSKIFGELSIILLIFTAFLISAAVSPLSRKTNLRALFGSTIMFSTALICCYCCYFRLRLKENKVHLKIRTILSNKKEIIVTLILVVLTRAWQLGTVPRWDSESYVQAIMNACGNFDFTLTSYLQSFQLCYHTTLGYALFLSVGAYLNPSGVYGINTINLMLVLFFTYFLYEILRSVFPKLSKLSVCMGTFLILAEPLACGTFGNINIDFPIMIFCVFLIFMHIRKYYLLFIFFGCILIQSKEVGIAVVFGYAITYLLQTVVSKKRKSDCLKGKSNSIKEGIKSNRKLRIQELCTHKTLMMGFGACLLILIYALAIKSGVINIWGDGVQFGISETNKSNYFAFVPTYILLKLKMIFVMNFYWLYTILILMFAVLALLRACKVRGKGDFSAKDNGNENKSDWRPLISLGGGLMALFIFNCLYVTWSNPRYHYALEMGIFMIVVIMILSIIEKKWVQQILFLFLAIISLSESYTTVDTVTTKIFEARDTGAYFPIAHPAWNANENKYLPMGVLKDMAVYNNQSGYMDKAYNKILREVRYNEELDIVIWDDFPQYNAFSISSMNAFWDVQKGKRTFIENQDTVPISFIYPDNIKKTVNSAKLKEQAIYIHTPSYGIKEGVALKQLSAYYIVGEQKTVSIFMQGTVHYYRLEAKTNLSSKK